MIYIIIIIMDLSSSKADISQCIHLTKCNYLALPKYPQLYMCATMLAMYRDLIT